MTSATDKLTIELLCKMLPCPFCGSNKAYSNIELGKHWVECRECTAESGCYRTEAEAIAAWNTRTHVTLTAEQVHEAIERHSAWIIGNNRCFHDDAYEEIADKLNAELGSGTCVVTHDFRCSNCGKQIGVVRNCEMYETCDGQQAWKSLDHEVCDIPNFCPNCGAKVVKR